MSKFSVVGDKLLCEGKEILSAIGSDGLSELNNIEKFLVGEPASPSRFVLLPTKTWINAQGKRIFNDLGDGARDLLRQLAQGTPYEGAANVVGEVLETAIETAGAVVTSVVADSVVEALGGDDAPQKAKTKAQLKAASNTDGDAAK